MSTSELVTEYARAGLVLAAVMLAVVGIAAAIERVRRRLVAMAWDIADARGILEECEYELWTDEYLDDPVLNTVAHKIDAADRILWHRLATLNFWSNRLDWRFYRDILLYRWRGLLFSLHDRWCGDAEDDLVFED